jgi:hypothetical protein
MAQMNPLPSTLRKAFLLSCAALLDKWSVPSIFKVDYCNQPARLDDPCQRLVGMPPIHLHVKKLVEQSHVCTYTLQATHAFHCLVDKNHKLSVEILKEVFMLGHLFHTDSADSVDCLSTGQGLYMD